MKGVKNYLKNVTKSIGYTAAKVAKDDLMPNVGDFVDSNKEFLATTYSTLKNPKAYVKKQVSAFKDSKIYQAIDYGARNVFDDLKTGKFYNKEREDNDSLKFAGSTFNTDNWNDLSEFGIDDDWESNLDKKTAHKDEITTGDMEIVNSIESSNKAVANTTASAIAAAAESNNKNSRINTAMLYNQNEKLFGGVHQDMSVLNATMDSIHKVVTQALPNIDKNMASYFSEASKDRKEMIAMMKESLEIQRKTAVDQEKLELEKRKKNGKLTWNDINNGGMPDLGAYFGQVKKNIKNQLSKSGMGSMANMMGEDSNMLAAMMTNPLGMVMETITKSLIPAGIKMATKELDKTLSSVFGTLMMKMSNAKNDENNHPLMATLSKFFGIDTSINSKVDTSKYYKGAVPFDGITRKAIVDVIPTYLRRIEAAITKQEEQLYDYKKGSWRSVQSVQAEKKNVHKNFVKQGTNDLISHMQKGIDFVRKGIKSTNEKKEFSEAIWEFQEYVYLHGMPNPKVSPEANNITSYGPYGKFYKYYTEIMTILMNMDFDKNTGRHRQLSALMYANNNVLNARTSEEKFWREAEGDVFNAINQISESGARFNKHGKFKGDNKDKFSASNMLLEMKDSLGNNMFDYMQKIAGELRFLRMDLASGVGIVTGAIDGNTDVSKAQRQVLYDSGDYDLKKVLINKSLYDQNTKKLLEQNRRETEERKKTENNIRSGKAIDHDYKEINKKDYIEQIAYGVSSIATKDYESDKNDLANENFVSTYMHKKYYDPKLAKNLSKIYDNVDKEIEKEEKKEGKTESATDSLLRRARQARARFQAMMGAPAEIFENLLYTADRAIYDMMFKAEVKDEDDKDNPEGAKGFMNLIAKKVNKVLDNVSEKAHRDILDPIMRRLGIDDPKKFKEDTKDAFTNIGGQVIKKFLEANKEVYGSIFDKFKEEITWKNDEGETKEALKDRLKFNKSEREHFKNHPEDIRLRNNAARALATGKYNIMEQHKDLLQTVPERREFLVRTGLYDQYTIDGYTDDDVNKAYFRHIQRTHAKGTMAPSGKPFKGLSTLHAGEAIFNSKGSGIINKTGLYDITEPTHILNRYDTNNLIGIKNNKSKSSTIASDLADEKRLQNNIFNHAPGTENNNTNKQQDKTEQDINKAVDAVKQKYKDVKDIDYKSVKDNVKLHLPEGIAGGAVGGIASTLLGIVGGPLIGALLGSAAGVISSSDDLKDQLFGAKDNNGKRNGGKLFGDKIMGFVNKYAPDMGKYGLAGVIPGLLTPLGPFGGLVVGAGIGFLKNNEKFMDKYFGEMGDDGKRNGGKLSLDNQTRGILKKLLPGAGKGAAVGAVAKLLFGGPFGLLGNAAIGAAVGMITTSDGFKESILGRMKDGVREGGLIGEIRLAFDPAKQALEKMAKNMLAAFDKGVVDPLSRFAKPFINQLNLAVNFVGNKIAKGFENHIVNPIGNFIGTIFRPFSKAFKFLGEKSTGLIKGFSGSILNPLQWLGFAGDKMKRHQIKQGTGVSNSMIAQERLDEMTKDIVRYDGESDKSYNKRLRKSYKTYDRDTALASIGTEGGLSVDQAKALQNKIQLITDTDDHLRRARIKKNQEIMNAIRAWHRDGSDAKISRDAQKQIKKLLENDQLDKVEDILANYDLIDTVRGESRRMTDDEINAIMNGRNGEEGLKIKLKKFKDLTERKKKVGNLHSKDKKSMTDDVIKELNKAGFNLDRDKGGEELEKVARLLGTEITNREANKKQSQDEKILESANAENIKSSANSLSNIYTYLKENIEPAIRNIRREQTDIEYGEYDHDITDKELKRSKNSTLVGGRKVLRNNISRYKTNTKQFNLRLAHSIADAITNVFSDIDFEQPEEKHTILPNTEDTVNEAAGTIIPMNGLGSLLLGGIKKVGGAIGKGASSLFSKFKKKNKAQSDIDGAANITNAFSSSNLDEVDKKGDGKDIVVNSTNGDALVMKRGSDGSVEPDTSDSKTKQILNNIEKEKSNKEKLDQAQLRQSEVIDEAFSDQQQDGKKMKWWQLLLYGIVAAPFIKKLFNNFLKPLWNDKLKPALGKFWNDVLLPGISSAITGITTFLVENIPTFITNLTDALTKIKWKELIFGTADAGGALMDTITGNKNNAGASNTMSKEDFDNATGNSHLTDDTGREVTYEDIRNGNYQGQLRNEQGDAATINDDGSLTVKDNSKHGSSFLKKELNGMFHAAVRHNPGKMTTMLSKASSRILKRHGLTNKIVGLAGKAITEPIKFAAHPLQSIRNAGKAINDTFNVTGKVQKASDFMGKVKDRIVNRAAYKQGSAMEHLINTTDTITENGVKKGSKIATMASKIKGGISNAGHKLATKVKSSKAATKIAEVSGAVSSKIAKIVECVEGVVEKLFSNSKVAKKLADCAEAVGKSADNFISAFKDKVVTVFKNGIKKGGDKVEKSAVSKALGKVGSFVGKALGIVTIVFDFITGCDKAESILGVKETSIVEEVVSGVINALCNFFIIPAIVPGVNWIAQLLMGFFNKDLKSRQADADAERKAYNAENHTNYSKEEYLEMTKSVTGKVKVKAKEAWKTVKGGASKAWGAVKGTAGKAWNGIKSGVGAAGNAIKKGVSGAVNAIKEGASDTWENIKALPTKVTELFGFAKSGNLKSFYGYKVSEDKTIGTLLANNIINMIKTPLSFIALPASIISFFKKHSKEIGAQFKDTKGAVGTLFKYATSGNLKSFYGYSAVDKDGSITSKISNVITNILKVPMSLIALPAKGISILKSGISKAIGGVKDVAGHIGTLFKYAKSGNLKSFYGYSAVDEEGSLGSKIANVICNATKVPMSLLALPAAAVTTVKNKFSDIVSGIMEIKDNNDSVIDKAMSGDISVFSSDYWTVSNTQKGFAAGLETVYSYLTRILKAPFVLIGNGFSKLKDWFDDKIEWMKDKVGDIQEFFDDPVEYFKDAAVNAGKSVASGVANGASSAWSSVKGAASSAASTVAGWFGGGKYGRGYDKQNDPSIANIRFNAPGDTQYQTIGDSGCGPAAAVSAIKSAYGRGANDIVNASMYALNNGYKEKNGGTKPGFFKDYFNQQGLNSSMTYDKSTLMKNIRSGQPTVLMGSDPSSNGTPYGPNPHYVTVTGVDGRGNAIVQDPESNSDNQIYNMKKLLNKSNFGVSVTGRGRLSGRGRYGRGVKTDSNGLLIGNTINIPSGLGKIHTYMGWQTITSPSSTQYKLREQAGQKFNSEGFATINGRYVIACTTTYGNVGDYIDFYKEDGNVIQAVIGDIKNQNDAGCNKWGHENGQCIVEFIVDKNTWYHTNHPNPGTNGCHPEWKGKAITKAVNGGSYFGDTSVSGSSVTTSGSAYSSSSNPLNSISSILGQTKAGKALNIFTGLLSGGTSDSSSTTYSGTDGVTAVAPSEAAEAATKQMEDWANDDSHGYDQSDRWGNPDFDCSGAVISAWTKVGVDVKGAGASYTGNMLETFKKMGFVDVVNQVDLSTGNGMQRGDVLLSSSHTAMYCGDGKIVHASISENNTIHGSPGDQTGKEFCIRSYYNKPWTHVLRYNAAGSGKGSSGKYGRGKGYTQAQAARTVYGLGKAVAAATSNGKTATNSYRSYSNSIKSNSSYGRASANRAKQVYSNTLNTRNSATSSRGTVNATRTTYTNNTNYNQLLNVIIEILSSIADNTDKLNVIVELLNEKLGTNINSKEVSQKAMNKESIKSKIRKALNTNNAGNDTANAYGDLNKNNISVIINTMNAIASE